MCDVASGVAERRADAIRPGGPHAREEARSENQHHESSRSDRVSHAPFDDGPSRQVPRSRTSRHAGHFETRVGMKHCLSWYGGFEIAAIGQGVQDCMARWARVGTELALL